MGCFLNSIIEKYVLKNILDMFKKVLIKYVSKLISKNTCAHCFTAECPPKQTLLRGRE
jgi:hypothetical protein